MYVLLSPLQFFDNFFLFYFEKVENCEKSFLHFELKKLNVQIINLIPNKIPGKYENVVFIIKILETRINVFKSNYQIMKNKKYYKISTIYECLEKIFTIRVLYCNFLNLYHAAFFAICRFNNFLLIDTTDRSKISSDQKRLFFAVSL